MILGALLACSDVDWSKFELLIDDAIPVTKDLASFRKNLNGRIVEFKKENKVEDGDLAYDVFRIQNSNLYLLRMGWFPSSGCMYVVRPSGSKFKVEEVAGFSDFKAYYAVMDHDHLVLAGSEYSVSNAKHPAVVSYRHWSNWVVSGVQVAEFEGTANPFVKKGSTWTCYANGRTCPKHIPVPHSGAHVSMQRTFVEQKGELLTSHDQSFPSLMGTFDNLIESTVRKNWTRTKSFCASDQIASKLQRLTVNSTADEWRIVSEDAEKQMKCRVADTDWVAVMERVGKTWKVTRFEHYKEPK